MSEQEKRCAKIRIPCRAGTAAPSRPKRGKDTPPYHLTGTPLHQAAGYYATFLIKVLPALAATLLMAGCIGVSFKEDSHITNRHVSIGQELIDLRTAFDEGLINDAEYEAARQDILKRSETDGPEDEKQKGE